MTALSERLTEITYLGPEGTFADSAVSAMPELAGLTTKPSSSISAAFDAVRLGTADAALVPIENSVEGSVAVTLDELNTAEPLAILGEVAVPVGFTLVARTPMELTDVTAVGTHPHAAAQCRAWLAKNLPDAHVVPTMSTAGAAAALSGEAPGFNAAIVPPIAARRYDVAILAEKLQDNDDAWTRFVLVGRPGHLPDPTGSDKSSLVLFMKANRSGALLEILSELAIRGVNLTRIESRPTRRVLGEYCFSLDLEGHLHDDRVAEALMGLHRVCSDVRFLGSYPSHGAHPNPLPAGVTDEDFAAARTWVAGLDT